MTDPLVSVIIPYFHGGAFIEAALPSIPGQNYQPLEILLADDGSGDGIAGRMPALGNDIVFLQQANKGPAAAKNLGLRHATGELITFLDADDLWPAGKLKRQVDFLRQDEGLGMVIGHTDQVILDGGQPVTPPFPEADHSQRLYVYLGASLIRRRVFDIVGEFDESMRIGEDQDWYLRVRENRIRVALMQETALIYQRHASNITNDRDLDETRNRQIMDMIKRSLLRRKQQGGKPDNLPPLCECSE